MAHFRNTGSKWKIIIQSMGRNYPPAQDSRCISLKIPFPLVSGPVGRKGIVPRTPWAIAEDLAPETPNTE